MEDTPRELKHCSTGSAELALVEYPNWSRYQVEAFRPDGGFLVCATDDPQTAEAVYLRASFIL